MKKKKIPSEHTSSIDSQSRERHAGKQGEHSASVPKNNSRSSQWLS
jgi:hypothetical protein